MNLDSRPDDVEFQVDILKDSVEVLVFCETRKWETTSMHTIVFMEKYRMLQVRLLSGILGGTDVGGIPDNLIQVEQLS